MMCEQDTTAFIIIDPYNDFMSRLGKAWPLLRTVTKKVGLRENLVKAVSLARDNGLQVAFAPHVRYEKGIFSKRKFKHPSQFLQERSKSFSKNSFGGRFHKSLAVLENDIVSSEHQCSSGFINTDLHQQLQNRGINKLIIAGYLTNTCVESTARTAVDLGYEVTLLLDCVASWTPADHFAAINHSYNLIAHHVLSLAELEHAFNQKG